MTLSPVARMILGTVRCVECGAGYGECGCAELRKIRERQDESLERMRLLLSPSDFAELQAKWSAIDNRQKGHKA